jgi:hypothetical protein
MIDNMTENDYMNNRIGRMESLCEQLRGLYRIRRRTRQEGALYNELRDRLGVYMYETLFDNIQRMDAIVEATDGIDVNWLSEEGFTQVVPLSRGFFIRIFNEEAWFCLDTIPIHNITEEYETVRAVFERVQRLYEVNG